MKDEFAQRKLGEGGEKKKKDITMKYVLEGIFETRNQRTMS